MPRPHVLGLFDTATWTVAWVGSGPDPRRAGVIDLVPDHDFKPGRTDTEGGHRQEQVPK